MELEENEIIEDFPVVHNSAEFLRILFGKKKTLTIFWRKKKMKNVITICAMTLLFATAYARAGTWTTLDYPGVTRTQVRGIDGSNLVGGYLDASDTWRGFRYNGDDWTSLDAPGAYGPPVGPGTVINGISGNNIVGFCDITIGYASGCIYDGTNWNYINKPPTYDKNGQLVETPSTRINGISGSNLVGGYSANHDYGFLYNNITHIWTTINKPGSTWTSVQGISGNNLVGSYGTAEAIHGFLYDGTTWTTIDYTGAACTDVYGIDGSNLVGRYVDASGHGSHGFLYNVTTQVWTTLDAPGAKYTSIFGISGSNLVGTYQEDDSGVDHGFLYTVPEPATLLLLGIGGLVLRRKDLILKNL
ncbi:MAG: hypothetical protein A2Y13_09030 [Planctomycetes bacterium GWC2_45_44]|nr:MAG: hypothetical protein A2Y13_09030 [Planctomycetes bacterium GWC2_45_44]